MKSGTISHTGTRCIKKYRGSHASWVGTVLALKFACMCVSVCCRECDSRDQIAVNATQTGFRVCQTLPQIFLNCNVWGSSGGVATIPYLYCILLLSHSLTIALVWCSTTQYYPKYWISLKNMQSYSKLEMSPLLKSLSLITTDLQLVSG